MRNKQRGLRRWIWAREQVRDRQTDRRRGREGGGRVCVIGRKEQGEDNGIKQKVCGIKQEESYQRMRWFRYRPAAGRVSCACSLTLVLCFSSFLAYTHDRIFRLSHQLSFFTRLFLLARSFYLPPSLLSLSLLSFFLSYSLLVLFSTILAVARALLHGFTLFPILFFFINSLAALNVLDTQKQVEPIMNP